MTSIGSSTSTTSDDSIDRQLVDSSRPRPVPGTQSIGGLATGLDTNAIIKALVDAERALENPIKNAGQLAQHRAAGYALIRTDLDGAQHRRRSRCRTPATWNALAADVVGRRPSRASPRATARSAARSRSPSTRSRARAACARRTRSPARRRRSPRTRRCSSRPAAGRSASRRSSRTTRSRSVTHTITVSQASSAATKTRRHRARGVDASSTARTTRSTRDQRHADDAHARARHVHREPARRRRCRTRADVGRRADHRDRCSARARSSLTTTREGHASHAEGHRRQRARRARSCRPTAPRTTGTDGVLRSTAAPNQTFSEPRRRPEHHAQRGGGGTITAALAGGLRTGHGHRQQREHRRRQPRDRRRQHQRRRRGRYRDGGAGRAQHVPAAAHVEHRGREQRREHRRVRSFNDNVGGFLTLTAAADAQITVGEGPGVVHRDLGDEHGERAAPGRHGQPQAAESTDPVTITVNRDDAGIADKVQALVDAANQVQRHGRRADQVRPVDEAGVAAHRRLDRDPA